MTLQDKLQRIDELQQQLFGLPETPDSRFDEDFRLNFTYHSNAIEGNTLTLKETKVVLEGVTIGGKSLREHFEVINHHEAIFFIEDLVKRRQPLTEQAIKSIHQLILKNIDDDNAGKYRTVNVLISGAEHKPPQAFEVPSQMQDLMKWYQQNSSALHPVIRASRLHIDFVGIHPFTDGNGRTSRLLMNLELLKNGYPAIAIKSDRKLEYYTALDTAHCTKNCDLFDNLVADYVLSEITRKIDLLNQQDAEFVKQLCQPDFALRKAALQHPEISQALLERTAIHHKCPQTRKAAAAVLQQRGIEIPTNNKPNTAPSKTVNKDKGIEI
ncbi:MAG: Fic family protein [Neisseriaceae bacterium]|nr:Fic family protein [Neisseriaceae bacterium]